MSFKCVNLVIISILSFSIIQINIASAHVIRPIKQFDNYWYVYKVRYNKTYSMREEKLRRFTWESHLIFVYWHNVETTLGHHTYTLSDNYLADLTTSQYIKEKLRLLPINNRNSIDEKMVATVHHDPNCIPKSFDWREKGFVTKTENQGKCGSCYAYSVLGTISGQLYKTMGITADLSEQQLVDCSVKTGNRGCNGGSFKNTLKYLEKSEGIMNEDSYPYFAKKGPCKYDKSMSVANITSWHFLPRDEKILEAAVATIGPIAVTINAGLKTFQLYSSGVYDDKECPSEEANHAMLIVGYTKDNWILQNWWGDDWGVNGFMYMKKGINRCGIANHAVFAKVT